MPNINPCSDTNAIKVVAFAISFTSELNKEQLEALYSVLKEVSELKDMNPKQINAVTVQITDNEQTSKTELGGMTFNMGVEGEAPNWEVTLRKDALVVVCRKYTRWEGIWEQSKNYLLKIIPKLESIVFKDITLEYVDEFSIVDAKLPWKPELFSETSKYIAGHFLELDNFWHTHNGFFTIIRDHKVLNNINIDYFVDNQTNVHTVTMRTQHKALIIKPLDETSFKGVIEPTFTECHDFNKTIMKDILSESMQQKIKLL